MDLVAFRYDRAFVRDALGRDVIQVLIVDRGFIDGAQMGRLQQDYRIVTIVPVRANMDLHADARGLARRRDFRWEPYVCPVPARPVETAPPKPVRVAQRKAEWQAEMRGDSADAPSAPPQTLLGVGRGLLSGSQRPLPLAVAGRGLILAAGAHKGRRTPIPARGTLLRS
jgi:hypothetical protein